jgi:membrane protein YqaA with SNARE-associated domain
MGIVARLAVVAVTVVIGATVGGFIGWWLGSVGGRFDQESVWFVSLLIGAATGAVVATAALVLRERK